MGKTARLVAAVATACVLNTACDLLNRLTGKNPNDPGQTPAASVSDFAGTWVIGKRDVHGDVCGKHSGQR
jgi:hypothetical protein